MNSIEMVLALVMEVVEVVKSMSNYGNPDWADNFLVTYRYHCDNVIQELAVVDMVHVHNDNAFCYYFLMYSSNHFRHTRLLNTVLVVVVDLLFYNDGKVDNCYIESM